MNTDYAGTKGEVPAPQDRVKCAQCGKPFGIRHEIHFSHDATPSHYTGKWTYRSYGNFCTLTCAARFANSAYRAGYRRP